MLQIKQRENVTTRKQQSCSSLILKKAGIVIVLVKQRKETGMTQNETELQTCLASRSCQCMTSQVTDR